MKIKIEKLVLDYDLYPRTQVDSVHVNDIVNAIDAGVEMPPLLVDRKTKRVVDGFHRYKAYEKRRYTSIEATMKSYRSEKDIYLDAVSLNSSHGRRFAHYDQVRVIARSEQLNMPVEVIATALNITTKRVEELRLSKQAVDNNGRVMAIKRTLSHFRQKELTVRQVRGNDKAGGMSSMYYVNQVINIVENGILDHENIGLMERVATLRDLLNKVLKKRAA